MRQTKADLLSGPRALASGLPETTPSRSWLGQRLATACFLLAPREVARRFSPPPSSPGRGDDGGKRGGPSALFPPIVAPRAQDPRQREPARVTPTYDRPVRRPGGADALPRSIRLWLCAVCALLPLALPAQDAKESLDGAVAGNISTLQARLKKAQRSDGSWAYPQYNVGATALAVMALLTSGVAPDDPVVRAGVDYIVSNSDDMVYSESLVICALELGGAEKYQKRIRSAVTRLLGSQNGGGAWTYATAANPGGAFDNSNTQFAVLGLAAAERCGVTLPDGVRTRALDHWRRSQNNDGGWGYTKSNSTLAMTCAGIASLHLLGVPLDTHGDKCGEYKTSKPVARGLERLAAQLQGGVGAVAEGHARYSLYALERVGMLLELKTIGGTDWYRLGAEFLLSGPAATGNVADDALALLFLAKGSAPIAMAKWRWRGDWNNDRTDVRRWVAVAGEELGQKLDCIPARLERLDSPAAKASLILVNGHDTFSASAKELAFLRAFIEAGGVLVGEACCGSETFAASFKDVMTTRLFPDADTARFVPIDENHPACLARHKLAADDVGALALRTTGCRRLRVLLLTRDISCALDGESVSDAERERAEAVAVNLLAWALQCKSAQRKLDRFELHTESAADDTLTADQVRRTGAGSTLGLHQPLGRVKHRGDWTADPNLSAVLAAVATEFPNLPRFDGEVRVSAASDDLFQCAVLFMNGHDALALEEPEWINLRTYLQNGGFLLAMACCSSVRFDAGFRDLLACTLPNDRLEPIPADDPIWHRPFPCRDTPAHGTATYRQQYGEDWGPLLGIRREGRWIVVYSPVDACCDLQEDLTEDVVGYKKESGALLLENVLAYALTP